MLASASLLASCGAGDDRDDGGALVVVTFGGLMRKAQMDVLDRQFREATGRRIVWAESPSGEMIELYAQHAAKNVVWDVVAVNPSAAIRGCERGLLMPLDPARLSADDTRGPANASAAVADFTPGGLQECAVGAMVWSMAISYRCDRAAPARGAADLFDLAAFPGRRALPKAPQGVLEWALLADGVPRDLLYTTLATPAGLKRAFAKLDTIKHEVIWWESGAQAAQLLADGEVVMAASPTGRVLAAAYGEGRPLCILWRDHSLNTDMWVVPARSRHHELAERFLRLASDPDNQARIAERIAYSPSRISAVGQVGHSEAWGIPLQPVLPTSPANFAHALLIDNQFWADNQNRILPQFMAWLSK